MTTPQSLNRCPVTRAEQVEQLRRKMASVSSKVGGSRRAVAPVPEPATSSGTPDSLLPVPDSLAELLPDSLPRGTVAVLSGARSLQLSLVAAVTAEGGHVAIIGQPDVGLLAAA
ncbi:hypothetical protein C6A85_000000115510, partial [Mycobacterium sp. ITM-2017-0098]